MPLTKWIITSKTNLKAKYTKDLKVIQSYFQLIIASDKLRNCNTSILYVDDARSAAAAGVNAIAGTTPRDYKRIVDALYKKHAPDYLMIFGAQDVVPFQKLENLLNDDDQWGVPSDLPYACDSAYNKNMSGFTGPTRVVSRLPDVPGNGDLGYVKKLVDTICDHKPRTSEDYGAFFAVSAKVWTSSTKASLQNIFGRSTGMLISPKMAPKGGYPKGKFSPLFHFYNCHGALGDTNFYGEWADDFPIALDANNLTNNIAEGTIVAAECCYGAELIDPANSSDMKSLSVASNYLGHKALAFLGSSTIAYGPASGQGLADLITGYFFESILNGASTGRALLEARQRFITTSGPHLDPFELKTLAQFYLLGDPSIVAIATDSDREMAINNTARNKRIGLAMKGAMLAKSMSTVKLVSDTTNLASGAISAGKSRKSYDSAVATATLESVTTNKKEIVKILEQNEFSYSDKTALYEVVSSSDTANATAKSLRHGAVRFHTFMKEKKISVKAKDGTETAAVINCDSFLILKEDDQSVLRWRKYITK